MVLAEVQADAQTLQNVPVPVHLPEKMYEKIPKEGQEGRLNSKRGSFFFFSLQKRVVWVKRGSVLKRGSFLQIVSKEDNFVSKEGHFQETDAKEGRLS